ncbi:MAG: ATP-dependent 6-phosphofructokinase [Deltaproteobacteria bacterium]|nr:ATP-dependent 6-phosphofructokinase [Deltaproteobacteria bacterium]MBW2254106.1 ATP-dependent 6-phosphofructokinase [Deltaproteobacteria bacterium]
MDIKRIGIMTGGGDCPGLNPVIRAAVTTAIRVYGWEVLGIEDAFSGMIDLDYRSPHGNQWLTVDTVHDILDRGGTILGTSNKSDPFHYVVERDGEKVETDIFDQVLDNFRKVGLDALISIGGDGSMRIARQAMARGLTRIVGVPKTIDNDLGATDYTFGFDSAVQVATEAIDRLRDTAESHDRVILVEVMGRDAGWIALHAGIAGGAQAILIPEIPYRLAPIADHIRQRRLDGHPYSIVVVAEGAKPGGGEVSTLGPRELGAMRRLFGAAARVAEGLGNLIELDIRFTVLGHVQRGGSPSNFDRILGTRFGEEAVHLLARGDFGKMVALRGTKIVAVPLDEAASQQKLVDPGGQIVRAARSLGIVFGDE